MARWFALEYRVRFLAGVPWLIVCLAIGAQVGLGLSATLGPDML